MKTGIVCEGGGMRGVYTAGVLQAFMDEGFQTDELVGVSAGASNGISYVSGQSGRGYRTNVNYCADRRYAGPTAFIKTGSVFGMDFIFGDIPEQLDPFDYAGFSASPCAYFAGATDVETGKAVFFGKRDIAPGFTALRASCSMPVASPIVEFGGRRYLDGGIAAPIPFQKALQDGCDRLIVILTRARDYVKKPQGFAAVYRQMYRQYPALVRAIDRGHLVYNHSLAQLRRLEAQGRAVVVAPSSQLPVGRMCRDREKMVAGYELGYSDGLHALHTIQQTEPVHVPT